MIGSNGFVNDDFFFSPFRYLLLVLMEAERAWSYAMQLKQEANTEPRKRFHLLARLRKAAKHSEKLEKLCESPRVDAKTKLEAQVLVTKHWPVQVNTVNDTNVNVAS